VRAGLLLSFLSISFSVFTFSFTFSVNLQFRPRRQWILRERYRVLLYLWLLNCTRTSVYWNNDNRQFITALHYASAVYTMALCPSVSVTSRCSTKTAKHMIKQSTPHDSPGTLVFWCQNYSRNSTGVIPYRGAKCRLGGLKSTTFDKITGYISKTIQDRRNFLY